MQKKKPLIFSIVFFKQIAERIAWNPYKLLVDSLIVNILSYLFSPHAPSLSLIPTLFYEISKSKKTINLYLEDQRDSWINKDKMKTQEYPTETQLYEEKSNYYVFHIDVN